MSTKTETEPDARTLALGELRELRAENESLRSEVRRAKAVADGIGLGLEAMRRRLAEAEARNSELQRRNRARPTAVRRAPLAGRWPAG